MKPSICLVFAAISSLLASSAFATVVAEASNSPFPAVSVNEVVQVGHESETIAPTPEPGASLLVSLCGIAWLFFRRRV